MPSPLQLSAFELSIINRLDGALDDAFGGGVEQPPGSSVLPPLTGYDTAANIPTATPPDQRPVIRKTFELLAAAMLHATENWHNVGTPSEPPFNGNWVNYDAATYNPCGFYRDLTGRVYARGLVKPSSGTVTGVSSIFQLSDGYIPAAQQLFGCIAYNGSAYITQRVDIQNNGLVYVIDASTLVWVCLDGISWRAA